MICRYLYRFTLSPVAYERGCFTPSTKLNMFRLSSVQFTHSVMSHSLRPHEPQHARPPCPSPTPGVYPTHVHWVSDAIQLSHALPSPSSPALNLSHHQGLFKWVSSSHQVAKVSVSTSDLPMNTQDWSPLGWTGQISLKSKRLSSLLKHHSLKASVLPVLSFLYSPTLTSIHGYWKNHSLD